MSLPSDKQDRALETEKKRSPKKGKLSNQSGSEKKSQPPKNYQTKFSASTVKKKNMKTGGTKVWVVRGVPVGC